MTRVISVHPLDIDVLDVELASSHGRHRLRRSQPDSAELEAQLNIRQIILGHLHTRIVHKETFIV